MTTEQIALFDDDLDDEESVPVSDVTSAFVTDTDWTTETILSQIRRGNIQLNPRFQRRDAWDRKRKSRFIESLILGLPIPQLVLAEDKRKRGSFIVLDGKQRLLTLSQFAEGSSLGAPNSSDLNDLRLSGLDIKANLAGMNLAMLESSSKFLEELDSFLNQTIRTVVVRNWPDEDFLNLVFLRLNTGSVSLAPQELRQALHPGPFTDFLDDYASDSIPLRRALNNPGPDFRMRDVELLLRFYANWYFITDYRGNLKAFLDDASDKLNSRWEHAQADIAKLASEFDLAIQATYEIFGDNAFRRYSPERQRFEPRFNRAVFEVVTHYFADANTRARSLEQKQLVAESFVGVSQSNAKFVESLQTTTKTPAAVSTRFEVWGKALAEVLGIEVPIARLAVLS